MAYKQPIMNAKLHKANTAMSNEEHRAISNPNQAGAMANQQRLFAEKKQSEIDSYNRGTCNRIDPEFQNLQLFGKNIIVRLHKENYIKNVSYYADGVPLYDAWISQVDGRMRQTQDANWIDNPLPYVFTGVVVAISPAVQLDIDKEVEALRERGIETEGLKVGDIVHLEHFMFAERRFYLNKQERDFLKNPEEYRVVYWEGYVKIHPSLIEAIVKDKTKFIDTMSPYMQHKAYEASKPKEVINADELL